MQNPVCRGDRDCGDGYHCGANHTCEPVPSVIGQACSREQDCGPDQTCTLTTKDADGDGTADTLAPTCQAQLPGAGTGATCADDAACATGVCAIGRCIALCDTDDDCPAATACVRVPRLEVQHAPLFHGCFQAAGTLAVDVPVDQVRSTVDIAVPDNALSFTIASSVGATNQAVGTVRLVSPSGALLYERPADAAGFWTQPERYAPDLQTSSMLVPNSSQVNLEPGGYEAQIASFLPGGGVGTMVPDVKVLYRLGVDGKILNVNLYFLNLADHACPGADLTAAEAENDPLIQNQFLTAWRGAFAQAGIALGTITYHDITGRPDLDSIQPAELPELYALSENGMPAINVFFVRSLDPLGALARSGGTPGPIAHGTIHSGVVLSADALCLMSWFDLGHIAAHETAHYLGLYHNLEMDGHVDPLTSSDASHGNLMYFGAGGFSTLSPEQIELLRRSPLLR